MKKQYKRGTDPQRGIAQQRTETTQNRSSAMKVETIAVLNEIMVISVREAIAKVTALPDFAKLSPIRQRNIVTKAANEITAKGSAWIAENFKTVSVTAGNRI
jgi:hypothetical protein